MSPARFRQRLALLETTARSITGRPGLPGPHRRQTRKGGGRRGFDQLQEGCEPSPASPGRLRMLSYRHQDPFGGGPGG
jgi:hypothetical protein